MFWNPLDYVIGKKRVPRVWAIPENQIEKFLKLYDSTDEDSVYGGYKLWKFIFKIIPELEKEFHKHGFEIDIDCVMQPFIKEVVEEN